MFPCNSDRHVNDPAQDRPAPPRVARVPVMLLLDPFLEIHDGPACEIIDRPRTAFCADALRPRR
jgi:hypothetical protein